MRITEQMKILAHPIVVSHSPGLVAVSILISIAAAYTAFSLSDRLRFTKSPLRRRLWLAGGSIAMGTGIWSMHYLGMLAVRLPVPVFYYVPMVVLSLLMAIAASAFALRTVSREHVGRRHLFVGGLEMGAGIGFMHYLGMAAMRSSAMTVYSPLLVAFSVVAAVGLSTLSLAVASSVRALQARVPVVRAAAALLMGLAIASMHYIAMAAAQFTLDPTSFSVKNTMQIQSLGEICIIVTTALVLLVVSVLAASDKRMSHALIRQGAMDAAEERYRLATQSSLSGIWDWDCDSGKIYLSARCQELVGLPPMDCTGDMKACMARVHSQDRERAKEQLHGLSTEGPHEFRNEYRIWHKDGRWIWTAARGTAVCGPGGKVLRVAGSLTDITEMRSRDPLTGLHNRKSILECIEQQLAVTGENGDIVLLSVGLDDFKRINAGFGQEAGDLVLLEVARRLKDTGFGREGFAVARIGGNEFAVLMGQVKKQSDGVDFAVLLQGILAVPIACGPQAVSLSASIGISVGNSSTTAVEAVLEDAEVARTYAKASGNGKFAIFADEMRERTKDRMKLEEDLRLVLRRRQLILHYQPKVLLTTGETVGFEALVRWLHPERGMISPAEFIPCAEENGLIVEMDRWTMREAVRQLKTWRDAGLVSSHVTMAVNLSAQQFEDDTLVEVVRNVLREEDLPPTCLALELTESALVRNSGRAKEMLTQLRQLGVGLDLDDFGTGFSSLSYLHRFPFHTLKIDQSFVRDLHSSQESRAIAQSILQLGLSLNMEVVAEGIETTEQAKILMKLGCLYGQGYLYSRPLSPLEIEASLRLTVVKFPDEIVPKTISLPA